MSPSRTSRVYDYLAGGKDNFAADREYAHAVMRLAPKAPALAIKRNREFLRRVVRYLAGEKHSPRLLRGGRLPSRAVSRGATARWQLFIA